jgi:predicted permease
MRRSPGLTALIVSTLAIGIGANATMAGAIDRLILRPPPHISSPDRVARLLIASPQSTGDALVGSSTGYPTLLDFREEVRSFRDVAAYSRFTLSFGVGADASEVRATLVSGSFFSLLGPKPVAGRLFSNADGFSLTETSGGPPLAVLGYEFWQRSFGGDPSVVGRKIRIGQRDYTVVGVAPHGFRGVEADAPDLWLPITVAAEAEAPQLWLSGRGSAWVSLIGRLAQPSPRAQAETEATLVWRRHDRAVTGRESAARVVVASVVPGRGADMPREVRVVLWLSGVSVLVLLIACANVASLLLARAFARRREIAVRLALGAGPWRLGRQMLVEALLLAGIGGMAAAYLATVGDAMLGQLLVANVASDATSTAHRFVFTALVALGSAGLISLAPLFQIKSRDLSGTLRAGLGAGGGRTIRVRSVLLAAQATLCTVLLVGAGLFAQSLRRIDGIDIGMDREHTLMVKLDLSRLVLPKPEIDALYRTIRQRAAAVPGVSSVALADKNPYRNGWAVPAHTLSRAAEFFWHEGVMQAPMAAAVDSGFFRTVGASVRGRDFGVADGSDAPRVAIVNEPLATLLWPGENPLGKCMLVTWNPAIRDCVTVVGVVQGFWRRDIVNRNQYLLYVPLAQRPGQRPAGMFVAITGDPAAVIPRLRSVVQGALPGGLPAIGIAWMRDVLEPEMKPWRLAALMFSLFGAVALVMAAVGLYGTVSFAASQRSSEIAIRMALGAHPRHVLTTVAGDGLLAVSVGLAVGGVSAVVGARWVGALLFQTSPYDPMTIAGVVTLLFVVAIIATLVPINRALRSDVASVLRID